VSWSAVIGVAGSLLGGGKQTEASAEAMGVSTAGTRAATESTERMFDRAMGLQDPYRQAGYAGLEAYEGAPMYGFSQEDLYKLQEDQAALQRIYSAQGKRQSGQAARGQMGLFQQASADAYNRDYGRLLEAGGIGAQAAGLGAGQAQQAGQGIASAYMQGAQNQIPYIQMQGQMDAANIAAISNMGGSIANYYQSQPSAPAVDTSWFGTAEAFEFE